MHYWWVNQNQTYAHEVGGGYLWSPKRKSDGSCNRFYDFMRIVSPGDPIFSFSNTYIRAFGFANSHCYEFPKPWEFGSVGENWGDVGWRVDVNFRELHSRAVRPKDFIQQIRPLLPERYSPLNQQGNGYQHIYLAQIPEPLARFLAQLIDRTVLDAVRGHAVGDRRLAPDRAIEEQVEWERRIEDQLRRDRSLADTERDALIKARVGQGRFRTEVAKIENACRVTRVDNKEHLIASHTKPWRDSNNDERMDPENGFLLTPTIDHLFDRGFISFENSGQLIVSPVADKRSLVRMGVDPDGRLNVGHFSAGQKDYLDWHRDNLLLKTSS